MNITQFLEEKVMPIAIAISGQRHLDAVRFAFITFMPFLIVGSFFLIIANLPIPGYNEFMIGLFGAGWDKFIGFPVDATFGIMSLYIVGALSYRLARSYDVDSLSASILATVCFFIITPFGGVFKGQTIDNVISMEWVGSKGLFVAIIIAIFATEIFRYILQKGFVIKMPQGVPPMVARSFAALLPAAVAITLVLVVRWLFMLTPYQTLHHFVYNIVAVPLYFVGSTLVGAILTVLIITLLWSVGLNGGTIVNGFMRPIWYPLQAENLSALRAGLPLPHIITEQFFDMIWMGGAGATIGIVLLLMLRARSQQYRELGKLAFGPAIFNINEPVLFGLPIVLNPIMLIPFTLAPVVMTVITYTCMAIGLVAKPTGAVLPWTTPPILQGWLITGSVSGALLQLFNMAVAMLIYWPFIKVQDEQRCREEREASGVEEFLPASICLTALMRREEREASGVEE